MGSELDKYLQEMEHALWGLDGEQRASELRERRQHIEAMVERGTEEGMNEDEAERAAIAQFGPARLVSSRPRRARRARGAARHLALATVGSLALLPVLAAQAKERVVFVASGSMEPGLTVGEHIVVQPRPYSSPAQVRRGDIVIQEAKPGSPTIKRVVALPGDSITLRGQGVWVNGKKLGHTTVGRKGRLAMVRESNAGASYVVQYGSQIGGEGMSSPTKSFSRKLGKTEFYLLGDNRDSALDSRLLGPASFSSIVAKHSR